LVGTSNEPFVLVSAINYEECSIRLCSDLLATLSNADAGRVLFRPFRLVDIRPDPWSVLEVIKHEFEALLAELARSKHIPFNFEPLMCPASPQEAIELLSKARRNIGVGGTLILDISAIPPQLSVFICDSLFATSPAIHSFSRIFVVQTPPSRIISRAGLGPFSVGQAQCVYNRQLLLGPRDNTYITLTTFLGSEGFEAKAVVDAVSGPYTATTAAIDLGGGDPLLAAASMIGNMALIAEEVQGNIELHYFFSPLDAFRLLSERVEKAIELASDFPSFRHAFLIAPFGAKYRVLLACLARKIYTDVMTRERPDMEYLTDVIVLPTSQYVSMYSRGSLDPIVFQIVGDLFCEVGFRDYDLSFNTLATLRDCTERDRGLDAATAP
jgi:hypothetical protein